MNDDPEIKGVIPSYYGFLITGITAIREYWAKKQFVEAINYAMNLTTFLPNKIKKELIAEKEKIHREMSVNLRFNSNDITAARKAHDRLVFQVAAKELEPFMDKVISLLDQNNLLTQQYGVPTRSRSMKDFQMTVDHAQYEANKGE